MTAWTRAIRPMRPQRGTRHLPGHGLPGGYVTRSALEALASFSPAAQLEAAEQRLLGGRGGPLHGFSVANELDPRPRAIDGRLLEAICARALNGARGAVFTAEPESRILAAFGLACAAQARGGPPLPRGVAMLLGAEPADARLQAALSGLRILDPACGGGALLVEAERLARRCGARLSLWGIDLAPLAARACGARLALLDCAAEIRMGNAFSLRWPEADLVLANPPFVRHEALAAREKAAAVCATGLPARADLSAHFAALALRRAPVAALVWPRALFTARSAAPLVAEAGARGGFALLLRSQAAGSFAASVDTCLAVWRTGAGGLPAAKAAVAAVPLPDLERAELVALARGAGGPRVRLARDAASSLRGATTVGAVCDVRFGLKSGCNGFFHLRSLGGRRYASALAGEVELELSDVVPLLSTLKEARAPEWAEPALWLFRPARDSTTARAYAARGEALGIHLRPTCASRSPWWRIAAGRSPAPVLYPAKIGARAFAFLNQAGLYEDKKWHALFPRPADGLQLEPWLLALVLSSTPVRLSVDRAARQLTGAQAIADVDCNVLAAAPFPMPAALAPLARDLAACRAALAREAVTTDLTAMLARPAQRELDLLAGRALGMGPRAVEASRREMLARVAARLEHAAWVRERLGALV
jgi:hypothetical protein